MSKTLPNATLSLVDPHSKSSQSHFLFIFHSKNAISQTSTCRALFDGHLPLSEVLPCLYSCYHISCATLPNCNEPTSPRYYPVPTAPSAIFTDFSQWQKTNHYTYITPILLHTFINRPQSRQLNHITCTLKKAGTSVTAHLHSVSKSL